MKNYIWMLLAVCTLTSCLKTTGEKLDYRGIQPLVLIPASNFPSKGVFNTAVADSAAGVTKLNLVAKYSFQVPAPKDITITFRRNDDLIATYNQTFLTAYKPLPADAYTMSSLQVVIPAGSQTGTLPITVIPDKIKGTTKYMIAFTVDNAEGILIAENYRSMIFNLKGQ